MKVVIVDDSDDITKARLAWLEESGHEVVATLDFDRGLDFDYSGVELVVVDAHDRRPDEVRAATRRAWGKDPTLDRFLGARVVAAIREQRPKGDLRVVVTSTYAKELALERRLWEIDADEVYPHDVMSSELPFLRMVSGSPIPRPPTRVDRLRLSAAFGVDIGERANLTAAVVLLDASDPDVEAQVVIGPATKGGKKKYRDRLTAALTAVLDMSGLTASGGPRRRRTAGTPAVGRVMRRTLGRCPPPPD
jgi:CheY-like chemotaxis protein